MKSNEFVKSVSTLPSNRDYLKSSSGKTFLDILSNKFYNLDRSKSYISDNLFDTYYLRFSYISKSIAATNEFTFNPEYISSLYSKLIDGIVPPPIYLDTTYIFHSIRHKPINCFDIAYTLNTVSELSGYPLFNTFLALLTNAMICSLGLPMITFSFVDLTSTSLVEIYSSYSLFSLSQIIEDEVYKRIKEITMELNIDSSLSNKPLSPPNTESSISKLKLE